jgi:hypothetical protein
MLHSWESFSNQPEGSFLPPANTSMSKSSKSPVSSSRQDQVLAGLLPEPLRLALDFFVAVFFVGSFAATIVIFLSVVPITFFLAEFARFVVGFPAAIFRSSALSDLVSLPLILSWQLTPAIVVRQLCQRERGRPAPRLDYTRQPGQPPALSRRGITGRTGSHPGRPPISGIRRAAVSALALSSYVKSVLGLSYLFSVFSFSKCFA